MEMMNEPWMRDILKFSLRATASSPFPYLATGKEPPELTDPNDPGKDPRFRKLVEAVLFSRRFIATYNVALLAILFCFTIWHWGEKYAMRRIWRRRTPTNPNTMDVNPAGTGESWSSSSSTVSGNATPPDLSQAKSADENSPLLPNRNARQQPNTLWKPYYVLRSWMEYQPRPIPIINKTLPPNSVSLLVVAFLAFNAFYNFYRMPLSSLYIFAFADRCGSLFVANLPLLYLLAAKNQPIKFLTGYSYESLNIFHRRVGELLCFEALLHFLGMMLVWYGLLRHLGLTLLHFLLNRVILLGLGAFVAYEVLYFTSLGSFRQRWYEIFLASHIILQVAGLVLLWFHHHNSRPYVGVSLAIFLVDRVLFRLWLKSSTHSAQLTILEDDTTVLLSSNWDLKHTKSKPLLPAAMTRTWNPNDHIFLTIPALSKSSALQSHPFTIFSAAPAPTQTDQPTNPNHAWLSLLIRAQEPSGFTHQLLNHARTHSTTRIRLDGPYGSSHALDTLRASDTAIVVAGGSGIAVAYPLLWALLAPAQTASQISDIESASPRAPASAHRKVKLIWVIHSASHASWLPEEKLSELRDWGLEVVVSAPTGVAGRPVVVGIADGWVEGEGGRTGLVVSGPEGLVRDVRNWGAGCVRRGVDVRVRVEKFGW